MGQQLGAAAALGDLGAFAQEDDLVAQGEGLIDVVGDEDDGLPQLGLDAGHLALEVAAHERVDSAEGLVHEEHLRIGGQCPGHTDPLGLAAGELVGVAPRQVAVEVEHVHELEGPAPGVVAVGALEAGYEGDVVDDAPVRQQPRVLHDVADGAAQGDGVAGGDVLVIDEDPAAGGLHHAVDHAQQGRLATAGRSQQDGGGAGLDTGGKGVDGGGT